MISLVGLNELSLRDQFFRGITIKVNLLKGQFTDLLIHLPNAIQDHQFNAFGIISKWRLSIIILISSVGI